MQQTNMHTTSGGDATQREKKKERGRGEEERKIISRREGWREGRDGHRGEQTWIVDEVIWYRGEG